MKNSEKNIVRGVGYFDQRFRPGDRVDLADEQIIRALLAVTDHPEDFGLEPRSKARNIEGCESPR